MGIRVRALERGFYQGLREQGDEFTIAKPEDLGKWMVPVSKLPKRGGAAAEGAPPQDDDPLP